MPDSPDRVLPRFDEPQTWFPAYKLIYKRTNCPSYPMALELNTSIDFLKSRVDKTLSVQRQIAAEWTWPLKPLAS